MSKFSFDDEIDARGANQSVTTTSAKNALNKLAAGDVLKVITTAGTITSINSFCKDIGGIYISQEKAGGDIVFFVKKA